MGTTLSSVHIYSNETPLELGFAFRSFSPNWQTCIDDFSERDPEYPFRVAKHVSKEISEPILYFSEFDSEMIELCVFLQGKIVARFSDDEFVSNKKIYDIPALFGYEDGHKRQLSSILGCSDTELKIQLLEEFFGVCLEFVPELLDELESLCRERGEEIYQCYREEEKRITGKAAPFELKKIKECSGKLFYDYFGRMQRDIKPHCFLMGYTDINDTNKSLIPVRFVGNGFETISLEEFRKGRQKERFSDGHLFEKDYYPLNKVIFKDACPEEFRSKMIVLPGGYYPYGFTDDGLLIIEADRKICIMDHTMRIIARLSIKGNIADIFGDYLLTTTGDSFCGYCYDPKAKIYIYKIINKKKI